MFVTYIFIFDGIFYVSAMMLTFYLGVVLSLALFDEKLKLIYPNIKLKNV